MGKELKGDPQLDSLAHLWRDTQVYTHRKKKCLFHFPFILQLIHISSIWKKDTRTTLWNYCTCLPSWRVSFLPLSYVIFFFFCSTCPDQYFGMPGRKHSQRLWWTLLLGLEQRGELLALPISSFSNDYLLLLLPRSGTQKRLPTNFRTQP